MEKKKGVSSIKKKGIGEEVRRKKISDFSIKLLYIWVDIGEGNVLL